MSSRKYKVVLIGSSSVGKTSIVIRFSKDIFIAGQESTIGAAFISRDIQTEQGSVSLHVWDTAGQERYKSLIPKYSAGAAAIIIVFDISDQDSFDQVKDWHNQALENHSGKVVWFLVGNKSDLPPQVDLQKAKEYAEAHDMHYLETSAATGSNIQELFIQIASLVPKLPTFNEDAPGLDLNTEKSPEAKKSCC